MIDSHSSLQSLHSCKLNTVAWVGELTHLHVHVIVKCESLLGGHGKACYTVIHMALDRVGKGDPLTPKLACTLLCLMPENFTRQWGTPGSQWVKAFNEGDSLEIELS